VRCDAILKCVPREIHGRQGAPDSIRFFKSGCAMIFALRHRTVIVSIWLVGSGAAACGIAFPVDTYRGSALIDASTEQGDAQSSTCGNRIPEPPSAALEGPDGPVYTWGLNVLEAGNDLQALPIRRYNLDGLCSCPDAPACTPPVGLRAPCDLEGGVDNSGGAFVDTLLRKVDLRSNTAKLRDGSSTLAIYLRGYNGTQNDPAVDAEIIPVVGTAQVPKWDGTDVRSPNTYWLASPSTLVSRIVTSEGYVRDGVLVVSFSGSLPLGDLVLKAVSARIVATISDSAISEGNIIFRTPAAEFVRSLAQLSNGPDGGIQLCSGGALDAVRATICNDRDLPSDPKEDGLGMPCTSLSFTARFSTRKIIFGPATLEPPYAFDCGPTFNADCP
jgi:hypothetical protein